VLFNGALYSVSFVKDISERVQAEQERKRLEERMLEAQKLESLGVLAGGIAHDFNNLLMVILGNLDLTTRDLPESSSVRPMLDDMNTAARQATDLCRQLLIYAGKGESVMCPANLGMLLRAQAQMLEISASKSVQLVIDTEDELPQILADASQLRQVFMNLIINASDAIGDSPGVITVTTGMAYCDVEYLENLQLSTPLKPGHYVFAEVTDTGCGMTEVVRSRVFDPFFSTKTTGRGLGLAAVRGIVHNHGGAIRIYSEVGKGTTFRLLFPVPENLTFDTQPGETTPQSWQGHGLVLLVDDEPSLRKLGVRMLERLGFDVVTASNGLEALATYDRHRDSISFVLLDWTMPEMGGGEALRELKARSPGVRVVVASGHAPSDLARRLRDQKVAAFVRKPYHLDELSRALQDAERLPSSGESPSRA
jgi:nitrogen-specific signal transduction histidine kinase/ActR/RegA family two-component response regulator